MYPIPGVSLLLTIVSFVLVMLTIFAGNTPGHMEDYHVLYFNTSTLGENLIPSLKARTAMPEPTAPPTLLNRFHAASKEERGFGNVLNTIANGATSVAGVAANGATSVAGDATSVAGGVASAATSAAGDALSALSSIENDLANELAKKLGIKEFYSIHLVDLCDGDFEPKATDPDATFNVTSCTAPFDYKLLNISALLDHELSVGPFKLNLADLGFAQDMQDKLNDIPKIMQAIVAMYIIAAVFIALAFFASVGAILLIPNPSGRAIVMGNLGLATLAVFFLFIGNLITTIGSYQVVEKVTKMGNDIGLYAEKGTKFMAMTWATFALMLLVVFYWAYEFFAEKQRGSNEINRAIGGFGFGTKSETAWSETSSGLASRENSFRQKDMGGEFPPTHAPAGMDMDEVSLEEENYGRGTHEQSHNAF